MCGKHRNKNKKITIIIVYGPNKDETAMTKAWFWEALSGIKGNTSKHVHSGVPTLMPEFAEGTKCQQNKDGKRLIKFCVYKITS